MDPYARIVELEAEKSLLRDRVAVLEDQLLVEPDVVVIPLSRAG